jgi:hypothetical protein
MNASLRSIGAAIAGVIAAFFVITTVEVLSSRVYPMPPGVGLNDPNTMREWILQLPAGAFLIVLAGWTVGAFVGGMLAARLAPGARTRHAFVVGALLLGASIANMIRLPHPVWMWAGAFIVFIPGAYLGARLIERNPRS